MLTHSPISTKPPNFRRSAIEPVGIVAAVSMKTIWKRKKARMPLTAPSPVSMKPLPPRMPIWPMRSSQTLSVSPQSPSVVGEKAHSAEPPTAGKVKLTPPNWKAKPTSQ